MSEKSEKSVEELETKLSYYVLRCSMLEAEIERQKKILMHQSETAPKTFKCRVMSECNHVCNTPGGRRKHERTAHADLQENAPKKTKPRQQTSKDFFNNIIKIHRVDSVKTIK